MAQAQHGLPELFARSTELRAEIDQALSSVGDKLTVASQQRLAVLTSELERVVTSMKILPKPSPVWIGRVQRVDEDLVEIRRSVERLIGKQAREELLLGQSQDKEPQDARDALLRERGHLDSASSALDGLISQGRAMFGGLNSQNDMIKTGNRKLLDVLNKSGVNVRLVQRIVGRERADALIVYVCMLFTLALFFVLWYFFRCFC